MTGGTPVVNERIAERRRAVRAGRRRRRLRRLVVATVVVLLATALVLAERSSLLQLTRVEVVGLERLRERQVLAAGGVELGTSVLRLRLGRVEEGVASLPLVESVEVARDGALGLTITVREVTPALTAVYARRSMLVSEDGVVLGEGDAPGTPHVLLPGFPPQAGRLAASLPTLATAHAVTLGLPGPLRALVDEVHARSSEDVELVLADGTVVRWGDQTRGDEKARSLGAVLEDLDGLPVSVIDVRAPGAPTVTP